MMCLVIIRKANYGKGFKMSREEGWEKRHCLKSQLSASVNLFIFGN